MRLSVTAAAPLAAAALALVPSAAVAAKVKVYAPPGKAGTSQYSEVVPSAGGNTLPPAMGGSNPTAAQISKIGSGQTGVKKLAKLGQQGAAAAQFAQATAPVVVHSSHGLQGQPAAPGSETLTGSPGASALSGIGHLLGGSDVDGIGAILPLLLAFGFGAAGAVSALRLRLRRGRQPPA